MHPALQIVAGCPQIAQFLCAHHPISLGCSGNGGFPCRNLGRIHISQPGFPGRDVKRQLVIEGQRLAIQQIQRLDVLQQLVLMAQKLAGDLVDLRLDILELGHEFGKGGRLSGQPFPPAFLAPHVQFFRREPAQRRDHLAQRIPGRAHVLVAHIGQHRLADHLQFGLRPRAESDDRLGVRQVDLGHLLANRLSLWGGGRSQRDDFRYRLGQQNCCHGLGGGKGGFSFGSQ